MQPIISERNHLWSSSFFSKCYKFEVYFRNLKRNWENNFCFGDNCIWIGCVKYSLLPGKNTCHRESISYQTVSIFQILLWKIFWNWSSLRLIKKYDKTTAVKIWVFPCSFSDFLTCWLSISALTQGFLGV